jgi:LmbE family N-acetylglucosaminyl deacetylase
MRRKSRVSKGAVLVVAAHPDDEVLGCGGTLARLADDGHAVHVLLLADGESARLSDHPLPEKANRLSVRNDAARNAGKILRCASVEVLSLPDNRLDGVELLDIVKPIESAIRRHAPTTVLTHHGGDVNVDHRVAHEAVLAACRPQPGNPVRLLLFFEVPSSTEWRTPGTSQSFAPNWFVNVGATLDRKLAALKAYRSELRSFPHPRSIKGVEALARWRGVSVGVDAAEAFIVGRNIID